MVKPNKNEKQADFISRCMSDSDMKKEYPDQTQRTAVCFSQWKKAKEEKKYDEKGRIIIAENVPVIFQGLIECDEK